MSNTNATQKSKDIAESAKPSKDAHLDALGGFTDKVLHAQVVVMTYIAPARTQGGIILPESTREEDRFQGKAALVVAMGPNAFKDDGVAQFGGVAPAVGDWVFVRPSDGMEFFYNGCSLRLFEDVNIKAIIADPMKYW